MNHVINTIRYEKEMNIGTSTVCYDEDALLIGKTGHYLQILSHTCVNTAQNSKTAVSTNKMPLNS